jgi:hypothetical protein
MGLFSKKKPVAVVATDPVVIAAVTKQKAELQKGLIVLFKEADIKTQPPPKIELDHYVDCSLSNIPKLLRQAMEIKNAMIFINASDCDITTDVFTTHVIPLLRVKLNELGIANRLHSNSVVIDVSDLRKFCRYDKLKTMT